MLLIKNNPFRILGISLFDSEKEIQKKITKITRFTEVGKEVSFDLDLVKLFEIDRNLENINNSKRKIEKPLTKVLHSLFWFYQSNHVDEIGFENLSNGDIDKTIQIWEKVVKDREVTTKNFSTLSNLKTLYYIKYNVNGFDKDSFTRYLELTGKFFSNEEFEKYSKKIINSDNTNITNFEITKTFIDQILLEIKPFIDKENGITYSEIINSLNFFSTELNDYVSSKTTSTPTNNIEVRINETSELRKKNPLDGIQFGKSLFEQSFNELKLLKKILGSEDVKYQILSDKLSNEILQCAIDFFNKKENCDREDGVDALQVVGYASVISCGNQIKSRIKENEDYLKDWVENAPDREKLNQIKQEYDFIQEVLSKPLKHLDDEDPIEKMKFIDSCESIVSQCKIKLESIKNTLGEQDELYLKTSSEVVQVVVALMVEYVNTTAPVVGVELRSVNVLKSLIHFKMDSNTRERFVTNKTTLDRLYSQSNKSSKGCYIATMVYGDYDDPNVQVLRSFRDEKLSKSFYGRKFIHYYYKYSPQLVSRLKDFKTINSFIRIILDIFILILKKYD